MIPRFIFFTKGKGIHKEQLQSFELALRDAGISALNLVYVSSIIPPSVKLLLKDEGAKMLHPGEITYVVMAKNETNEPHRLVSASIGAAWPANPQEYGYLSEHHSFGQTDEVAGEYAEDLAASMLATTMGIPFDVNAAWDEREQQFKAGGHIVKTTNITQSTLGDKDGKWTTVIAAAVFLP